MSNAGFSPAVLIPVYNHEGAIENTLSQTLAHGYPVLLVDDGSRPSCADLLKTLAAQYSDAVTLLVLSKNSGKGAAVKAGFSKLQAMGFSHSLQIDADGQHDFADIPKFVAEGERAPAALINGCPQFDDSISKMRFYGRYLTHIWVWINSLSFKIEDSMCGFRLYPLKPINEMLSDEPCGNRMDFDSEVIVRWLWRRGEIINLKTKVGYATDGVSHFKMVRDNILISWMHTRLFFGMLKRLPSLLGQRF